MLGTALRLSAALAVVFCSPAAAQKVFFGNLHSHTSYSDGTAKPADAYKHARNKATLDFLLISEHNHSQAGRIATDPSLYKGPQAASWKRPKPWRKSTRIVCFQRHGCFVWRRDRAKKN